jgi:MoxR-like ATPase
VGELPAIADQSEVDQLAATFERIEHSIRSVVRGDPLPVRLAVTCLFAEGHLLIEDLPGVGKTTLARAVSASIQGRSTRVQFTPDLLPSDVTGMTVFDPATQEFTFRPGPVFANLVLADEINRASPKVQSALLEVMEERQVTADATAHGVPRPFMVIATQNPFEMEGTYRLPEAQLDRFLLRISMGLPDLEAEVAMVRAGGNLGLGAIEPVAGTDQVAALISIASRIHVADEVIAYAAEICRATRAAPEVRIGASPRATLALVRTARVIAAAEARRFVSPDDVQQLASPVLAHRLSLTPAAEVGGIDQESVVAAALARTPPPRQRD